MYVICPIWLSSIYVTNVKALGGSTDLVKIMTKEDSMHVVLFHLAIACGAFGSELLASKPTRYLNNINLHSPHELWYCCLWMYVICPIWLSSIYVTNAKALGGSTDLYCQQRSWTFSICWVKRAHQTVQPHGSCPRTVLRFYEWKKSFEFYLFMTVWPIHVSSFFCWV